MTSGCSVIQFPIPAIDADKTEALIKRLLRLRSRFLDARRHTSMFVDKRECPHTGKPDTCVTVLLQCASAIGDADAIGVAVYDTIRDYFSAEN